MGKQHQHEWGDTEVERDHEYITVSWGCDWAEVTGSHTSREHDEVFYEYGAECGAWKKVTYKINVDRDEPEILAEQAALEYVLSQQTDTFIEAVATVDPYGPSEMITISGEEIGLDDNFLVSLEKETEQVVDEGVFV